MKLLESDRYAVERAVLDDAVKFENAKVVIDEPNAAVIKTGNWYKCVFGDARDYSCYDKKYGIVGNVCMLGAPEALAADPCFTYAYLEPMPPLSDLKGGVEIKRLGACLAETVLNAYHNPGGGYTVERIASIMRDKGIFGAIKSGKLAGFIGRHGDGSMGMLEVFEPYRRHGIGASLEKFLITYVMTFGRTPFCDVYCDNPAVIEIQNELGLKKGCGYTYWRSADKN